MAGEAVYTKSSPQEREQIQRVQALVEMFDNGIGVDLRERFDRLYKQYRGFKTAKYAWEATSENDRDEVLRETVRDWGSKIHVPYAFAVVEAMLPIALAQRPGMQLLPRDERWEENVVPFRRALEAQQDQIDLELRWEDVMRDGFTYGLGIGKAFWTKKYEHRRRVVRRTFLRAIPGQDEWVDGKLEQVCVFDDPDFRPVDPHDFMWAPLATDVETADWVVHRMWLSTGQVMDRLKTGAWNTATAQLLKDDEAAVRSMGNGQKYDEVWNERMVAQGLPNYRGYGEWAAGEQPHEVWEFHDGSRVLTVLDRQALVVDGENPCVGLMPFQVFRPTPATGQMCGIGEIEPIEHLCRELDMLRSQRRDAATIALCSGYAFDDTFVSAKDLVFGPAAAIRVRNSRPQDAIFPLPRNELPGSSYREEESILSDLERITGLNDALGANGTLSTATEAQLVQVAVAKRVGRKSRRFEVEVIRNNLRVWKALNQRMVKNERDYQVPAPSDRGDNEERIWETLTVGPAQFFGDFDVKLEGGARAENTQQKRMDAGQKMQTFGGNPHIDQRVLLQSVLRDFDVEPERWLTQQQAPIPPAMLDVLVAKGVRQELIDDAIAIATRAQPQLPGPQDVEEADGLAA